MTESARTTPSAEADDAARARSVAVGVGGSVQRDMPLAELQRRVEEHDGRLWLGVDVTNRYQVAVPFVLISGMWGMNFQHIPLSGRPNAFWWMLALQLGLGALLLVVLRFLRVI